MITLRGFQAQHKRDIYEAWASGSRTVLGVLPTGAGKTVIFSDIVHDHDGASAIIAHRQELMSQTSVALARDEVRHRIVGPPSVVRLCVAAQMAELNRNYIHPNAVCGVVGVDTLTRRTKDVDGWMASVSLWVQDEAHHLLRENKWGKAIAMFPNAKGLGVTATPSRADGNGLGRHADGVFDSMVIGPGMRELINDGYLCDYRIFAPPSDIKLNQVTVSRKTGDYNPQQLKFEVRKSHITGDVVQHYIRIANGKLGVTFATDVETATDIAKKFNASGVPAAVLHAKTPNLERVRIIRKFRARQILQVVNVDLLGEGFDLPDIEVISMARPTQSYGLYVQQFGRVLRILEGKEFGIIIDHVGNVIRHGLPDAKQYWTLDRQDRRGKSEGFKGIPVRSCGNCTMVYERIYKSCPFCGHTPIPILRSGPEFVDGDLSELSSEALAQMRGEINEFDMDVDEYRSILQSQHLPDHWIVRNVKSHIAKQQSQSILRQLIANWAGVERDRGRSDSESRRLFYHRFKIDIGAAQTLGVKDASVLTAEITEAL